MHLSFAVSSLLFGLLSVAQTITFINPGPNGTNAAYQNDPNFPYGSTIDIQWSPTPQSISIVLCQQTENAVFEYVFQNQVGLSNYQWTVATSKSLSVSRIFFFQIFVTGDIFPIATSHYFNITGNATPPSSSSSSSSSSTVHTTTSSQLLGSTSTMAGTTTTATSTTATSVSAASAAPMASHTTTSGDGGLSTSAQLGLGITIPVAVIITLVIVIVTYFVRKRNAKQPQGQENQQQQVCTPPPMQHRQKDKDYNQDDVQAKYWQPHLQRYYEMDGQRPDHELGVRSA